MKDEGGGLERGACIGELLPFDVFLAGHQKVIPLGKGAAGPIALMEVVVGLEQATVLILFVRPADLLSNEPTHTPQQSGLS